MLRIKLLIFDLDGVLVNSKLNMEEAWKKTKSKFKLKPDFEDYFKFVGLPFEKILLNIGIKTKHKEIKSCYSKISRQKINLIKPYKGLNETINYLKKNGIKVGIVTSKDKARSKQIVKKFRIKIDKIISPTLRLKGKPSPDQLNEMIKKFKIKKKFVTYVGDTDHDIQSAKRAGIFFIFAQYGYSKKIIRSKYKIQKFSDLKKIIYV